MSLARLNVMALLKQYGLTPKKGLGQNFLLDEHALQQIVTVAEVLPGAEVLEVGPGLGSLTRHLAHSGARVVAVELDASLLPVLHEVLSGYQQVELVQGDIMALNPGDLMQQDNYLVVANIPYYITSALIRHLLEAPRKPGRIVLTIQREVAERICAKPGDLSLLALSVQVYGKPVIAARIPAGAFFPPPQVDSSVLRIDLYPQPIIAPERLERFFALIKAGFSQRRKTLRNSLAAGMGWQPDEAAVFLSKAGIDAKRRAETVSIEEWRELVNLNDQPGN